MTENHISTYLRFLALTSRASLPCDLVATKLLQVIAVRGEDNMTVTEVMSQNDIASPASLHRKLDDLLTLGLVELTYRGANRRTKYVVPTMLALAHFRQMGKAIAEARGEA